MRTPLSPAFQSTVVDGGSALSARLLVGAHSFSFSLPLLCGFPLPLSPSFMVMAREWLSLSIVNAYDS